MQIEQTVIAVPMPEHLLRWLTHLAEQEGKPLEDIIARQLDWRFLEELDKGRVPADVLGDHIPF